MRLQSLLGLRQVRVRVVQLRTASLRRTRRRLQLGLGCGGGGLLGVGKLFGQLVDVGLQPRDARGHHAELRGDVVSFLVEFRFCHDQLLLERGFVFLGGEQVRLGAFLSRFLGVPERVLRIPELFLGVVEFGEGLFGGVVQLLCALALRIERRLDLRNPGGRVVGRRDRGSFRRGDFVTQIRLLQLKLLKRQTRQFQFVRQFRGIVELRFQNLTRPLARAELVRRLREFLGERGDFTKKRLLQSGRLRRHLPFVRRAFLRGFPERHFQHLALLGQGFDFNRSHLGLRNRFFDFKLKSFALSRVFTLQIRHCRHGPHDLAFQSILSLLKRQLKFGFVRVRRVQRRGDGFVRPVRFRLHFLRDAGQFLLERSHLLAVRRELRFLRLARGVEVSLFTRALRDERGVDFRVRRVRERFRGDGVVVELCLLGSPEFLFSGEERFQPRGVFVELLQRVLRGVFAFRQLFDFLPFRGLLDRDALLQFRDLQRVLLLRGDGFLFKNSQFSGARFLLRVQRGLQL